MHLVKEIGILSDISNTFLINWTQKSFGSAQGGKIYTNNQSLPMSYRHYIRSWGTANSHHILIAGYNSDLTQVNFGMRCFADISDFIVYLMAIGY